MIMPGMNRGIASIAGFLVDSDDDSGAIPKMTIPPAMIKIAEIIKSTPSIFDTFFLAMINENCNRKYATCRRKGDHS